MLRIYDRNTQRSSIQFIDYVLAKLPFAVEAARPTTAPSSRVASTGTCSTAGSATTTSSPRPPGSTARLSSPRIDDEEFYQLLDGVVIDAWPWTTVASWCSPMANPGSRRDARSKTVARYSLPSSVGISVRYPHHRWSIASALNSRLTRSGIGAAALSERVKRSALAFRAAAPADPGGPSRPPPSSSIHASRPRPGPPTPWATRRCPAKRPSRRRTSSPQRPARPAEPDGASGAGLTTCRRVDSWHIERPAGHRVGKRPGVQPEAPGVGGLLQLQPTPRRPRRPNPLRPTKAKTTKAPA